MRLARTGVEVCCPKPRKVLAYKKRQNNVSARGNDEAVRSLSRLWARHARIFGTELKAVTRSSG